MYLLTVAVLIISMIGIYTQVLAVQTARVFANQNSVALAMTKWHSAALSMAASIIKTNNAAYTLVATNGCSLTVIPPGYPFPTCPAPKNGATVLDSGAGTVIDASNKANLIYNTTRSTQECVHLPVSCTSSSGPVTSPTCNSCAPTATQPYNYDVAHYQFYSVLYQDAAGVNYVVTFVPAAANPTPGYITLASGTQLNMTIADLTQQLNHTGKATNQFGGINSAHILAVPGTTYTLPAGFNSYPHALAIIASPDGY